MERMAFTMKKQKVLKFLCLFTVLILVFITSDISAGKKLLTVAESSDFTATSMYEDVMVFIRTLQKKNNLMRVETLCTSPEGRKIPLLVIGNPPPPSPKALIYDSRAVVYIQANIHAGEVEGKEASLMLLRDILTAKTYPYLDNLVILIAPIFNADGNEKISIQNRRNQDGPEKGVGIRYNGQNLDLNRDGMKLESPEVQGLVRNVLNRWDPVLLVDCHTTNGSYHIEPVTYAWPLNPNGDPSIISYMHEKMMPAIQKNLRDTYGTLSIPYGNFMDFKNPEKGWSPAGPQPRYLTNYIGLRNRLAILNENYAHADYKTRVLGCYNFLASILDYCSVHKDEIKHLIKEADRALIRSGLAPHETDTFILEYDVRPLKDPVTIIGWEMEVEQGERRFPRVKRTDKKKTYTLPYYADYFSKKSTRLPFGYLFPAVDKNITDKLIQHGIVVEQLLEPVSLEVETFRVKEIKGAARLYQGHRMNSVKGEYTTETREFPAGTLFVGTGQALGKVVAYLMEAESDDGLLVWNYFDKYLVSQWSRTPKTFPVHRVLEPVNLVKDMIRPE